MFAGCVDYTYDISTLNFNKVKYCEFMFAGCAIVNIKLELPMATCYKGMFKNCSQF